MASFKLVYTPEAETQLAELRANPALAKRFKSIRKALGLLAENPRHPSLNTHRYDSFEGPNKEDVFEAYAENQTPAAYRIFFYYGVVQGEITIFAITPHP